MECKDWKQGYDDGYHGRYAPLLSNQKNWPYLAGHAPGTDQRLGEYRSTCKEVWQTIGMTRGADARQVKHGLGK